MIKNTNPRNQIIAKGFTLMELVVTVSLSAVVLLLAAPSFSNSIKNSKLTNKTNDLVVAFGIARQTAVARAVTTFVCPSSNADAATPACDEASNDWSKGFLVYTAPTNTIVSTQRKYLPASDALIMQSDLAADDIAVGGLDVDSAAVGYLSFASDGLYFGNGPVEFEICDDRVGEQGRTITISAAGRVSTGGMTCT